MIYQRHIVKFNTICVVKLGLRLYNIKIGHKLTNLYEEKIPNKNYNKEMERIISEIGRASCRERV